LYNINESHYYLKFSQSVNISIDVSDIRSGFLLYNKWGNFPFLAEPIVVNDYCGENFLGESYTKVEYQVDFLTLI